MKTMHTTVMVGFLFSVLVLSRQISAGEEQYQGCKLFTDNKGNITSMQYTNLTTYLNIEKEFLFTLNADGTPANCTITFNDGVQREMKRGEMELHFAQCGGPNTVWDYYRDHGKVVSYSLDNDKLPSSAFGKVSRLTLRTGWRYIGRLGNLADKPDGMSLAIEGASGGPIPFNNNTVATVELMK